MGGNQAGSGDSDPSPSSSRHKGKKHHHKHHASGGADDEDKKHTARIYEGVTTLVLLIAVGVGLWKYWTQVTTFFVFPATNTAVNPVAAATSAILGAEKTATAAVVGAATVAGAAITKAFGGIHLEAQETGRARA